MVKTVRKIKFKRRNRDQIKLLSLNSLTIWEKDIFKLMLKVWRQDTSWWYVVCLEKKQVIVEDSPKDGIIMPPLSFLNFYTQLCKICARHDF